MKSSYCTCSEWGMENGEWDVVSFPPLPIPSIFLRFRAHVREEDHVADRMLICQDHDQAVDPDPFATGRRHPVRERADVILVEHHRLLVASLALSHLFLEAAALFDRVVQFREGVGDLHVCDIKFETIDEARVGGLLLRERRKLGRKFGYEGRA